MVRAEAETKTVVRPLTLRGMTQVLDSSAHEINRNDSRKYHYFYQLLSLARAGAMHRMGKEWTVRRISGPTNGKAALVYDERHMREMLVELRRMAESADARVFDVEVPRNLRELRNAGGVNLVEKVEQKILHPEDKTSRKRHRRLRRVS